MRPRTAIFINNINNDMCLYVSSGTLIYGSLEGAHYNACAHNENVKCAVIAYRNENYTVELHLIILLAKAEWRALHCIMYAVADIVISGVLIWYFNIGYRVYDFHFAPDTKYLRDVFVFVPFVWIAIFVSNRSSAINIREFGWKTCFTSKIDLNFEICELNSVLCY